jgi:hypothetical protein
MNHAGAEIPANGITLVGMARWPRAGSQFDWVRAGIGIQLRSLYSHVLNEPLPEKIVELLKQLDEQLRQLDQDTDKT